MSVRRASQRHGRRWRILLSLLLLHGCAREEDAAVIHGHTMGTLWHLRFAAPLPAHQAKALQHHLQQQCETWEAVMSHWRPESALSRFNAAPSTDWITVPTELIEVVELAQQIGADTEHALDITLAPLVELWGFGAGGRRATPPRDDEIAAAQARCGWQQLQTRHQPPALRKRRPDLHLNVSAVAEGWALDKIATQLESRGHTKFLLEIGGEILTRGAWPVGIQTPAAPPGEAAQTLTLKDQSLATSGVYRQHFQHGDREYSHILDPRTGRPIAHPLAAVSVIHPSAAQADGYATALLVLGPEQGRQLAQKLGLQVVWFERVK